MSMLPIEPKDYSDGRTSQAFKDATDINKMLARAQKAGTLSHLQAHQGEYGDFSDFDFFEAQNAIARGKQIFAELPSELRKEFHQDPSEFFAFVNDPNNRDQLHRVLPDLAKPGRQNLKVRRRDVPNVAAGDVSEPVASETTEPDTPLPA